MPTDIIEQMEIESYIDGELDLVRRLAVEDYLARNPDLAARVMADFRTRSALQLLTATEPEISRSLASTVAKIRVRSHSIWRRPLVGAVAAVIVGMITMVGLHLETIEPPPAYVGMAVASHRSVMDRAPDMVTAPDSIRTQDFLSASRIVVPSLPADWQVTDVQMLTSEKGPAAMLIAVRTNEGHPLSIFAIRERSSAPEAPDAIREGSQSVAYWSAGDISYALMGEGDPHQLDAKAEALTDLW